MRHELCQNYNHFRSFSFFAKTQTKTDLRSSICDVFDSPKENAKIVFSSLMFAYFFSHPASSSATGMAIDENRLGAMDAAAGAVAVAAAEANDALAGENGDDEQEEESEADKAAAEAQRVAEQYSRHSWELLVRRRVCHDA